jgi:hypothetical protein
MKKNDRTKTLLWIKDLIDKGKVDEMFDFEPSLKRTKRKDSKDFNEGNHKYLMIQIERLRRTWPDRPHPYLIREDGPTKHVLPEFNSDEAVQGKMDTRRKKFQSYSLQDLLAYLKHLREQLLKKEGGRARNGLALIRIFDCDPNVVSTLSFVGDYINRSNNIDVERETVYLLEELIEDYSPDQTLKESLLPRKKNRGANTNSLVAKVLQSPEQRGRIDQDNLEDKFASECKTLGLQKGKTIPRDVLCRIMAKLGIYKSTPQNFTSRVQAYTLGRAIAKRLEYARPQKKRRTQLTV